MKLNFMWIKTLCIALRKDSTLELQSVTLLDLNEDCLRHIGYYLSIEDTYSLGHTCTQLFGTVSKTRTIVTIENPNDLKYLKYFGAEARTINVDTEDMKQEFTENDQKNLLTMMENCTNVCKLRLLTWNSGILRSAFLMRSIRNLAYLHICLMELPISYRPNFVESLVNCENLRRLTIDYDASSSSWGTELFATEFPKLKFLFLFVAHYNGVYDDSQYFLPLNIFLRVNSQLKILKIYAPIFEEYLEAIVLCQKLERIELAIFSIAEKLIPKLLILNKLPVLEYTLLTIDIDVHEQLAPILQQIQSLRELIITCTLFEDFIRDIFQIPQITSLILRVPVRRLREIIKRLRYHEESLYNLTRLELCMDRDDEVTDCWTTTRTTNDLNEFIKFIINCSRIESIVLPLTFPIHRFYKQLLKYEKKFGHHVRKKTLYLKVVNIQWIFGYSDGRRTHNVIIRNNDGDEPDTSISSIVGYALMQVIFGIPSVYLCLFCMLIGKLIHVIQNIII